MIAVWRAFLVICLLLTCLGAAPTTQQESQYEADLAKRADGILNALDLDDAQRAARIRELVIAQYRSLREIHDSAPKDQIQQKLSQLHDLFLSKLAAELTPDQIERIKDKMTYDVVHVTYNAYLDELPQLTDAQKSYILSQLKEAREIAMDQGSSKEKHAVFGKYKGRINNYLAKEGYDLKKAEREGAERRKARAATQGAK